MTDDSGIRVYRVGAATRKMYPLWLFGGVIFGMGLVANLSIMVVYGDGSLLGLLLSLAVVASVTLGYVASKRAMTTITPDHIEVRNLGRIRQIAWEDIQRIEVGGTKSLRTVVIHDTTGRRTGLRHMTSGDIPAFTDEVDELREMWKERRGPDWEPASQQNDPSGR